MDPLLRTLLQEADIPEETVKNDKILQCFLYTFIEENGGYEKVMRLLEAERRVEDRNKGLMKIDLPSGDMGPPSSTTPSQTHQEGYTDFSCTFSEMFTKYCSLSFANQ